ncbi:MAG: energy-coupling factor ABC transporter ATP-binding protein [Anaerolineae bacterium]|jgi:cobalt/nickel transport system ATP-binding protein|nr:energy-coupling factor ABC transporter ATP-binding protein [Anaerolineae bacterium]MDH7473367.1 ABC transporter ATP-binding protein [Anaerolineae bacterium]
MDEKIIQIEGLSFTYPDGHRALNNISLTVNRGESVAFIGPNGAGKSTLLLHLNGILRSPNGAVKVLGHPVAENYLRLIRSKVGLVFQDPEDQLFSPTVFDDVAFGPINMGCPEAEIRQRVNQALQQVQMGGYEKRSPHHLSVGEKKRIAIATVLSMNPEVLVLDEPTSNLDPRGRWELIELLRGLPLTKLIATHDLEMVRNLCERTILLDRGRIVADGPTPAILTDKLLLAEHGLAPPIVGQA